MIEDPLFWIITLSAVIAVTTGLFLGNELGK